MLGIGLATGEGVSVGLLVAIFVSNLPESIGSSTDMREAGAARLDPARCGSRSPRSARSPRWSATRAADAVGDDFKAAINGFAAGALLVMLIDSMIPEATAKAGRVAGLVTVLGFASRSAWPEPGQRLPQRVMPAHPRAERAGMVNVLAVPTSSATSS